MKQFAIRFSAFTLLWVFFIFFAYNESSSLTLIITLFATSLTVHFFVPIVKKPLVLYLVGQIILISTLFWTSSFEYILPLISLSLLEGAFQLQERQLWVLVGVTFVFALTSLICVHTSYAISGLFVLFGIVCLFLNRYSNETKEKRELYEELLGEYRNLKRTTLQQEEVVRLEERTRVARDIHDSVGHKLTALLMQLEMDSMTGLYRVLQEALTNAMKHGASREVEVTLRQTSTGALQFLVNNTNIH